MAYTPKTWQCGETIMADDLNHMEQGIAQGGSDTLVLTVESTREATAEECENGGVVYAYNHTWQEVHDALAVGKRVVAVQEGRLGGILENVILLGAINDDGVYLINGFGVLTGAAEYSCANASSKLTLIQCGSR